ncbi:MAG: RES domain-containing protein [Alcaligenaceae bacterium]|nr:MAG: RES domain-containing protein [Alcaligenaceae bacterium]
MNLTDLNPPFIELPDRQTWHRIQRTSWRKESVRTRGFILAPFGVPTGRFDLPDEPTSYLADSELTACYEALFRRDKRSYTLDQLRQRSLIEFRTAPGMRLVDLRGLEENYPVLQSLRYETTQAFAADARKAWAHGVMYASAQHPYHSCICLFQRGVARMTKTSSAPLVQTGSDRLHRSVVLAALGSQVAIVT